MLIFSRKKPVLMDRPTVGREVMYRIKMRWTKYQNTSEHRRHPVVRKNNEVRFWRVDTLKYKRLVNVLLDDGKGEL